MLQLANGIPPIVLSVPFTAVFSRFRPVGVILVGSLISLPFVLFQGLAINFITLFLARVLFSSLRVVEAPARTLLLQQWLARKDYVLVSAVSLSVHSVMMATAFATLPLIIRAVGGWRVAFAVLAAIMLAQLVAWRFLAQEKKAPVQAFSRALGGRVPNPLRVAQRYPQVFVLGVVMFALGVTWSGMVTFLPTLLKEERHMALTWGGPLSALLYVGLAAGAPFGDLIGRKVQNPKVLLSVTALLNVLLGVAIALTGNPWLLMVFLFGLGVIWATAPAIMVMPFGFPGISSREVAVASALQMMVSGLGFSFGPVITGFAADQTGSLVRGLLFMSLFTSIGVIAGLFYPVHRRSSPA